MNAVAEKICAVYVDCGQGHPVGAKEICGKPAVAEWMLIDHVQDGGSTGLFTTCAEHDRWWQRTVKEIHQEHNCLRVPVCADRPVPEIPIVKAHLLNQKVQIRFTPAQRPGEEIEFYRGSGKSKRRGGIPQWVIVVAVFVTLVSATAALWDSLVTW
jgi:hypothetical protein